MDGFFGWFLIIVGVLAIFNAEKLPALRQMLEEKFKDSVDAAKAGSKTMRDKIEKVKTDIDNRKNAPQAECNLSFTFRYKRRCCRYFVALRLGRGASVS